MSLKKRIKKLEDKVEATIVYTPVVTRATARGKVHYHYKKVEGGKTTKLTQKQYESDREAQRKQGKKIEIRNPEGFKNLSDKELRNIIDLY